MQLSRALILDVDDLEKLLVRCPEWGGDVYVRVLTARERETYEEEVLDPRREFREKMDAAAAEDLSEADAAPPSLRIPLVRMCTCNADGDALFLRGDDAWLAGKSSVVTGRLFDAAWKLNKLGRDEQEEMKKNLESAQDDDSNSVLLSPLGAPSDNCI